ncbi:Double-strand break repair protein mre11a [Entophlyctis luteolus]|nr:Double-strand break repair protein mre11a [Entophlyctis luteolus]
MSFRILIATDNHLGFLEKDAVRADDSFVAFREILALAVARRVDFVLLGGDLFHDNRPSRKTLHKTITLLRQFCMGDKPCEFDFVSAQDESFKDAFATVNYQDPNYNVSIPIFSIHGNHDDPSGDGDLCALDLLSAAGLVNYFGRAEAVDDIRISPMLLTKESGVKLAIYGLGNVRDERLYRTFVGKKVRMLRPAEDKEEWFNIFVIHQNRVKRGPTNYIPESFLPDFLHLVIWGHEHDCLIDLEQNDEKGFYISQPGSSVATSLSEGEMIPKHVGILEIHPDKQFKIEKVQLKTVRPFVMDDIVLADCKGLSSRKVDDKRVEQVLVEKVEEMIETARNMWLEGNPEEPEDSFPKPLIRLRVDYSSFTTLNPQRFGQKFVDRVANVKDILLFHRKRASTNADKKSNVNFDIPVDLPEKLDKFQVQDLVDEFLAAQSLEILPENGIGEAVRLFVEKEDKDAITEFASSFRHLAASLIIFCLSFVAESLNRTRVSLEKAPPDVIYDEDNLMKQISKEKKEAVAEISEESAKVFGNTKRAIAARSNGSADESEGNSATEQTAATVKRARATKTAGAKAKTTVKPATRKRATNAGSKRKKRDESSDETSDNDASALRPDDDDENDVVAESPRLSRRDPAPSTAPQYVRYLA